MKTYITKCNTISVLNSFESGILSDFNSPLSRELIQPDYKDIIPATHLRRMSKVIRLGVSASLKVMEDEKINGILVGSGLGCFDNSILFSKEYIFGQTGLLSPTSFIQSTDNMIAGQIGVITKNNSYNITYTNKGISFENAMFDALLLVAEGQNNILVGGVDQKIDLFELKLENENYWLGEGSSFFLLSNDKKKAKAQINTCQTIEIEKNLEEKINSFLKVNSLSEPELILYGNSFINSRPVPKTIIGLKTFCYSEISGVYFTNSSFGLQLAVEIISNPRLAIKNNLKANRILIMNNFNDKDYGLFYLTKP